MFRKLLFLFYLLITTNAIAQHVATQPVKTTEKQGDTQIDYKQVGAPMPPLRVILYHDTSKQKQAVSELKDSDSSNTQRRRNKKKKKQNDDINAFSHKQFITNKDLDNGANAFVMIFNPTCSHCEDETALLENNISLFNRSKFVMIATPPMQPYLGDFVHLLHVNEYPVFSVGIDSSGFLNNVFMFQALPQINIYNSDQKLIKIFTGEVSIDSLKQYIE